MRRGRALGIYFFLRLILPHTSSHISAPKVNCQLPMPNVSVFLANSFDKRIRTSSATICSDGLYVPAGQGLEKALPDGQYWPGGHTLLVTSPTFPSASCAPIYGFRYQRHAEKGNEDSFKSGRGKKGKVQNDFVRVLSLRTNIARAAALLSHNNPAHPFHCTLLQEESPCMWRDSL